jgi:hypothetical protein
MVSTLNLGPKGSQHLHQFRFISSDNTSSKAGFRALAEFGAPLAGLSPSDVRDGSTFQIGQSPACIDLLQRMDGIDFEDAWKNPMQGFLEYSR